MCGNWLYYPCKANSCLYSNSIKALLIFKRVRESHARARRWKVPKSYDCLSNNNKNNDTIVLLGDDVIAASCDTHLRLRNDTTLVLEHVLPHDVRLLKTHGSNELEIWINPDPEER